MRDATGAVTMRAGQQLARFADARADGSTLSGNWLYIGMYTDAGNLTQRRSYADPSGLGRYPEWTVSWPANRRILYNRCSADAKGRPWDPTRVGIAWNGQRWVGDTPDYHGRQPARGRSWARSSCSPRASRACSCRASSSTVRGRSTTSRPSHRSRIRCILSTAPIPAVRPFGTEFDVLGTADEYPIVCTTYRLTEHFHYWTKNNPYNVQLQPEFFVEIPEELAREKGIANGDRVRVTSARGSIEGRAMVTRRIKPMQIGGKTMYQIGFPIHWGFLGTRRAAWLAGQPVTPTVVDPNSFAPEYKGFLVKLEKVGECASPRSSSERSARDDRMPTATLELLRVSATTAPAPGVRSLPTITKLIDTTTCIGCKACEVACQEWNDLPPETTVQMGTYQTLPETDGELLEPDQVQRARGERRAATG